MKKETRRIIIASILAFGLLVGLASAQPNGSSQQQPYGHMMGGGGMYGGGGMMGGNQGYGGGMGCGGMMGGTMMDRMTPGQQQSFMNQTTELRKQMMELRFAYREAMRNPDTKPENLAGIEKQMLELRTKMMGKMETLQGQ
ncbi:MAG: hypothetical protein KKE62_12965 [Proteobacteria bacterium]|nr:hypothetical protein [Pseudomonadota bacterium]MBU1543741.1 hypothetical protein [Pseudomonadota bacterium]MBU2481442.1 hypothetical protein [Pseudomonadota bacterium]